ncbi:MAG: LuxR C-terminal-related transcriptional regulator [bacterium]
MIKLLVADKLHDIDSGLQDQFTSHGIEIVAHCRDSEEVFAALRKDTPDVVMMSFNLGGLGAFETIDKLRMNYPRISLMVQLVHSDGPFPKRLLETGASGFISRNTMLSDIVSGVHAISGGDKYISPEIAQKIAISLLPGGESSPLDRLSEREMQVMLQLSQGESPLAISSRLALSPKTVSTYKHRVRDKLRVDDTQEIYNLAGVHGLLER